MNVGLTIVFSCFIYAVMFVMISAIAGKY